MLYRKRPLIYIPNKKKKIVGSPTPPTPTSTIANVEYRHVHRFKDIHTMEIDVQLGSTVDGTFLLENNPTTDVLASGVTLRLFLIYRWGNDLATYLTNTRWLADDFNGGLSASIQSNMMVIAENDPNVYRVANRNAGAYQFNIARDNFTFTLPDSSTQVVRLNKVSSQFYLNDVLTQLNTQYGITPYCMVFPLTLGTHLPFSTADILTIFNKILVSADATFGSKTNVVDYQFT